jgi:opacity protein-like surface antigen
VQADLSGLVSEGTKTCFASSAATINFTCRVRPEVASTLTARVGYAFDPFNRTLLYLKGGGAWADSQIDLATNNQRALFGLGPPIMSSSSTTSMWGWTVGAGAEYALSPTWSLAGRSRRQRILQKRPRRRRGPPAGRSKVAADISTAGDYSIRTSASCKLSHFPTFPAFQG